MMSARPANPEMGDCYLDDNGQAWIYITVWIKLVSTVEEFASVHVIQEEP